MDKALMPMTPKEEIELYRKADRCPFAERVRIINRTALKMLWLSKEEEGMYASELAREEMLRDLHPPLKKALSEGTEQDIETEADLPGCRLYSSCEIPARHNRCPGSRKRPMRSPSRAEIVKPFEPGELYAAVENARREYAR